MDLISYALAKKAIKSSGDSSAQIAALEQRLDEMASTSLKRTIVDTLPEENINPNTVYMIGRPDSEDGNLYSEFMYIDGAWERIGDTKVDLSNYATKAEVAAVRTYRAFPQAWKNASTGTIKAFCNIVNADPAAVEGTVYLGELCCSDFRSSGVNIANGDAVVEIIDGTGTSDKVIHILMTSANTIPHRWEYTYWNNGNATSGIIKL